MVVENQIQVHKNGVITHIDTSPTSDKAGWDASYAYIDPTALLSGLVELGKKDYIGPFVRIQAANAFRVKLSDEDNLQDNVSITACSRNTLIGEQTSVAHGAQVIDSELGNLVFIGFNAFVENAVIEDGAMVLHGARVIGVTIPRDRIVPPGAMITNEAQTESLPWVEQENIEFKEEVIAVNVELASGYGQLDQVNSSTPELSKNPRTSWNKTQKSPLLGRNIELSNEAKIIGCVHLGDGSSIGRRTSIRGDEGVPIIIGKGARIGDQVTFHALKGQSISIGEQLTAGTGVVFHGELTVRNQVIVGDYAVVFKATIGSHTSIGKNAVVIGVTLAENSRVPDGALVLNQNDAKQFQP